MPTAFNTADVAFLLLLQLDEQIARIGEEADPENTTGGVSRRVTRGAAGVRATAGAADLEEADQERCLLTSLVISNIET